MFSPSVSLPLTLLAGRGFVAVELRDQLVGQAAEALRIGRVHQFSKLPVGPKRLPWSS